MPPKAQTKNAAKSYYKILSIDGGGIRGIIPAAVMVAVEAELKRQGKPQQRIGDCFDMVAGTSTGGILTCLALAPETSDPAELAKTTVQQKARFTAEDALKFYMDNGDEIFDQSVWQKIKSAGGLNNEKYSAEALERVLKRVVGDLELRHLIKPCVIPAYDVRQYKPHFFTQHDARANDYANYLVRDVARATSAAPTYFEAARPESLDTISNSNPMIDGGVFANNPTACALVEALRMTDPASPDTMDEIAILSLGTGRENKSISYNDCKNWGLAGWAQPLIGILMEGVSQAVDYQMQSVFMSMNKSDQYLRIDGKFGSSDNVADVDSALDNASLPNMKKLEQFGRQLAQNHKDEIEAFVGKFC